MYNLVYVVLWDREEKNTNVAQFRVILRNISIHAFYEKYKSY